MFQITLVIHLFPTAAAAGASAIKGWQHSTWEVAAASLSSVLLPGPRLYKAGAEEYVCLKLGGVDGDSDF